MYLTILSIYFLIYALVSVVVLFTLFSKNKIKYPWLAFISPVNAWYWLKLIGKPKWWIVFMFIPYLNFFVIMLMWVEVSVGLKRNKAYEYFLAAVFPFIYFPYLFYVKKEEFVDPKTLPVYQRSAIRNWTDPIVFAGVAALIIRGFFFEGYMVPSSSMEKSLLVGDYVYVSKFGYGTRLPITPLAIPFVHHTLPGTATTKSYLDWITLPYERTPGFKNIERNDIIVFNYPDGDTVSTAFQSNASYYALVKEYGYERVWNDRPNFGEIVYRPIDKRENFVKRCIAVAGDTLEIKNQFVYINGKYAEQPELREFNFMIYPSPLVVAKNQWKKMGVSNDDVGTLFGYGIIPLTLSTAETVRHLPGVDSVVPMIEPAGKHNAKLFPFDANYPWNLDNYGPVWIPKKGVTIDLTLENLPLYTRIIQNYENHDLKVVNGNILIDNKPATQYTFTMDYYWAMGDNRHNSADSRYWGFVPEDHIKGQATYVWLSIDKDQKFPKNLRWSKMFRRLK